MSSESATAPASLENNKDYLYSNLTIGSLFRKGVDSAPTALTDAEYWEVSTKILFIKNNPAGTPALYQYDSSAASEEQIIDGVESMQVSYGMRSCSGEFVESYVTSPGFHDESWDKVSTIQVDLLVRSLSPNGYYAKNNSCLDNANTYTIGNYTYTPADTTPNCYYRRVFTTIIQLRNSEVPPCA